MSEEKAIRVPTGFLEIVFELDATIPVDLLAFMRSAVVLNDEHGDYIDTINVKVAERQVITLEPATYKVQGILGRVYSKEIPIKIEAGKIEKVVFHFGKTL